MSIMKILPQLIILHLAYITLIIWTLLIVELLKSKNIFLLSRTIENNSRLCIKLLRWKIKYLLCLLSVSFGLVPVEFFHIDRCDAKEERDDHWRALKNDKIRYSCVSLLFYSMGKYTFLRKYTTYYPYKLNSEEIFKQQAFGGKKLTCVWRCSDILSSQIPTCMIKNHNQVI